MKINLKLYFNKCLKSIFNLNFNLILFQFIYNSYIHMCIDETCVVLQQTNYRLITSVATLTLMIIIIRI